MCGNTERRCLDRPTEVRNGAAAAIDYRRIAGMIPCGTIWSRKLPQIPPWR